MTLVGKERFTPFTKDGQPVDAAFRAAAKVPAEWMGEGIMQQAPFNVDEFVRLCSDFRTTMAKLHRLFLTGDYTYRPSDWIASKALSEAVVGVTGPRRFTRL
jgi:hypothetical protein